MFMKFFWTVFHVVYTESTQGILTSANAVQYQKNVISRSAVFRDAAAPLQDLPFAGPHNKNVLNTYTT